MTTTRQRLDDHVHAFCHDTDAYLAGAAHGPLTCLTFAAKDIFDVGGYVTGGGNPDWQATHAAAARTAPLPAVGGLPVGLSWLGARGSDEVLLTFARHIATGLAP
jgi:amidase